MYGLRNKNEFQYKGTIQIARFISQVEINLKMRRNRHRSNGSKDGMDLDGESYDNIMIVTIIYIYLIMIIFWNKTDLLELYLIYCILGY